MFKNLKNDFKVIHISVFLFVLVLSISILNYVPGYPGGWSFLRQLGLLTIGFYALYRMLFYSNLKETEIQNIFINSVFLLSVMSILGIGKSYIDGRLSLYGMNPNIIGFFAVIAILFLTKNIFFNEQKRITIDYKIIYFISIILMLFSTGSRGGILSLVLIFILFLYFKEKKSLKKIEYIFLSALVSLFLYVLIINDALLNRRFFGDDEDTDAGRLVLWEKVISIFKESPIFGVGVFKYQREIESLNFHRVINTHNEFLSFLVYSGIIGLLVFIYFLFKLYKLCLMRYKVFNDPVYIILLIILIFNLFKAGGLILSPLIWGLFSYILVYTKIKPDEEF